ncbi:MAG: glycoside hydrolase family 140 protein [Oscillospiraceae bacterium]|nr:glycoside hydrolase family 140 protein [Oscillospiraceae bacterium]
MEKCVDLKISPNGRCIVKKDGSPFFWLGDTAWELFHRLNKEEAVEYLTTRASQKFTVIQAVALSEFDGLTVPNAYGRTPLLKNKVGNFDPELPDINTNSGYTYWDHMDFIIDAACSYGLYIGLLPTWGDKFNLGWGKGPVIFTTDNAYVYGKWIGERYKNRDNIIWIMGGDRPLENDTHKLIVRNIATGIKEVTGGRQLMTFHPTGFRSSSENLHDESWLDFNMIQSGHGGVNIKNYEFIQKDRLLDPVKPTLDGEPRYEDHPVNFNAQNGYFDDYDVRVAAYWATLSGALGHTYGHHEIWSFTTEKKDYYPMHWREAIHRPGAEQMKYVKELLMSRNFLELTPYQKLLSENYEGANYMSAARGQKYAFIYIPNGLDVKVNMGILPGDYITAFWYDPRNGGYTFANAVKNEGVVTFNPPSSGRNNDWVLLLDSLESL